MRFGIAGLAVCLALIGVLEWKSRTHVTRAGFWFEDVTYGPSEVQAPRLGAAITAEEMTRIQSIAWSELGAAYSGFRVAFSADRGAMYTVRVIQSTKHHPLSAFPWSFEAAGESRPVRRFGGTGVVNFRLLANYAIMHAPAGAARTEMMAGIGRGIGRAAAHEFAHLFLASAAFHRSQDAESYDYDSADRAVQYYGQLRWDVAGPLLRKQFGPR